MAKPIVAFVVKRVGDLLVDEAIFLYKVREEVKWVERELRRMLAFLEDADAKRKRDERVKNWVRDVREAAYQAEDLVECFILHAEVRWCGRFTVAARWSLCLPRELVVRHRFGEEIKVLRAKMQEISESRARYGIENLGTDGAGERACVDENVQERRRVALHTHSSDVVGMKEEKDNILRQLFDKGVKRRAVISIVGMGGLGKTTLAKMVYNTITIKSRFQFTVWINVSQQYKVTELLQDMVKKVTGDEEVGKMSREQLEEKLYKCLEGRKYLIVMDDVWDNNVWNTFNDRLPDASDGSRVLITTRSIDVARAADPCTPPYELRFLNDDESWELFSKKVFPHQDVETACPEELKELGKQIAKRCGGLPLALVLLGGMLSRKPKSALEWGKLAETMSWQRSEDGQMCMDILALSYNDLPLHLRWCFLYLGSFPEDFEIDVDKLMRLWIAEGFVAKRDGAESLEETAEAYLEELFERCLVLVTERSSYGGIARCRIHDLLHDLAMAEAREMGFFECHRHADHAPSSPSVRRLSLHQGMETYLSQGHSTPNLRTLLGFSFWSQSMDLPVKGLKLLRVIDLEGAPVQTLPDAIGDVAHLRYLGLKKTRIKCLPTSIGKLRRLQILDAYGTRITKVPNSVWRIKTLRHIYAPSAVQPQISRGSLRNLHVLIQPNAGSWIHDGLAGLTSLQKLGIVDISESHSTALSASLESLPRLISLDLASKGGQPTIPSNALALCNHRHLHVLKLYGQLERPAALQPYSSNQLPPNLTEITLAFTRLDQDPLALLEKLHELRILILLKDAYMGKEMACSSGGFPRLQVLRMEYQEEVEQWTVEDGAMPCLWYLMINSCKKLGMLPQGLEHMPALQEFTLQNMPDDFYLRVRKGEGEDGHKIQHVPSIIINNEQIT